jgi:tetratricopeptide (TPR) repeat protein
VIGRHIPGVAQSVAGNIVGSVVCAGCVAIGLSQTRDFNDPRNWPIWAGLLIGFSAFGFVGTGANATRLWWKKWRIARSPAERFTVILADLAGDDPSRGQKQNVRDSLQYYLGSSIHIITYPQILAISEGDEKAELAKTHATAQKILEAKRGDVLIWGRVKSHGDAALALYFTGRSIDKTERVSSYTLVSDAERALELPLRFDRDLGAAIAARVVAVGDALIGRQGDFLTPYAGWFVRQIEPLVVHPKANWTPDARGAVFHACGLAKSLLGAELAEKTELEEAVAAYRAALAEYTRERVPLQWAMTQNNLGTALLTLGERESGTARLEEAVAACRAALEEWTRERVPLDWAMTQNNLGNALRRLGERESGTARLEEAVAACRAALEEWTRERVPLDWATTQNNLGNALLTLGARESGTARLEEAVAAYRAALQEYTRERVPLEWAATQNNLGNALQTLGERESGTARLEEAVAACRAALEEWTRERVPLQWATTQNNLGNALSRLGERESGTARLEEAVAACRAALEEWTRERVPLEWAATQNNLGNALRTLGERESGTARLEEAVAAYRAALQEYTRERVPLQWATTQNNLGNALRTLGERESGTARLEEAVAAFDACLIVIETAWPAEWVQQVRSHRDETQAEVNRRRVTK